MTYQTFTDSVVDYLHQNLGKSCKITIQPIIKNNHLILDGLTILEEDLNVSPTIYLNYYYSELASGEKSMETIQKQVLQTYLANRPTEPIDVSFFTNYENVRRRFVYKLVNQKQNEELLSEIPHVKYLDLAIIFYCLVSTTPMGNATILIHNNHLNYWNITRETLYQEALHNTPLLLPHELLDMNHVLSDITAMDTNFSEPDVISPMNILTNTQRLNGAGVILYPKLLEKISDTLSNDLYVIPSSIHEVLLLPAEPYYTVAELNEMIDEVNTTQVSAEEILSNHVYYYSRKEKALQIPESILA